MPTLPVAYAPANAILTQIGLVVVRWARLEALLRDVTYKLIPCGPKQGRLAVREPREADYPALISDLLEARNLTVKTNLKALSNDLKRAAQARDELAHGVWLRDPKTRRIYLQVTRGKSPTHLGLGVSRNKRISPIGEHYTVKTLKHLVATIDSLVDIVDQLDGEVRMAWMKFALASSPQRSQSP